MATAKKTATEKTVEKIGLHNLAPAICMKMLAEMYGMMPSANTVDRDSWPPVNRL